MSGTSLTEKTKSTEATDDSSKIEMISFEVWVERYVQGQAKTALSEQLRDPGVINQVAAAGVEKAMQWMKPWQILAKIVLYILTIVIAFGAAVFGYFGIRTASNVRESIHKSVTEAVDKERQRSETIVKDFENQLHDYRSKMVSLETDFDSRIKQLNVDLSGVKSDVDLLRQKVFIGDAPQVSDEVKENLQRFLGGLKAYLGRLGFRSPNELIRVDPDPKFDSTPHFDPSRNTIFCGSKAIQDNTMVARHYVHSLLEHYWKLPNLESGLADYFVCSFVDNPKFGATYMKLVTPNGEPPDSLRDLKNSRKFSDVPPQTGPQDAGEVWAATFWQLRELLGQEKLDGLIARTIMSFSPELGVSGQESEFIRRLANEAQQFFGEKESEIILSTFRERDYTFMSFRKP